MKPHPEVVKAYKKKLDADHKASDYNYGANKTRATKAEKHLFAKINKHHPDLSQQDKIKLHTELGKMNESLWKHIRDRRAAGKPRLKPGDKNYPKTLDINSTNTEDTTTASIPNPAQTSMGPRFKTNLVHDRRKKKGFPKLLKRFRDYYQEKGIG